MKAWGLRFLQAGLVASLVALTSAGKVQAGDPHPPHSGEEAAFWLKNMREEHGFSWREVSLATGWTRDEARLQWSLLTGEDPDAIPVPSSGFRVWPYPGGRHPRIGFLEGAIEPRRETKLSLFSPWHPGAYAVMDIPEAIWWNPPKTGEDPNPPARELLYLAHTHIPTTWDRLGRTIPETEWCASGDQGWEMSQTLPNGVRFGVRTWRVSESLVAMEQTLQNPTSETLTGLRVQNCVMLKGLLKTHEDPQGRVQFHKPYALYPLEKGGDRWLVTAWTSCERAWGNPRCPCLHSDPRFPDCPPGQKVSITGIAGFVQGKDAESVINTLEALPEWASPLP